MSPDEQLDCFIAKFAPVNRAFIRACRARMLARFPDACELVYDNYNFLVIAYSATPKPSHAALSLAADKHGVTLCLLVRDATVLGDPTGILRGSGRRSRTVALASADDLDRVDVVDVMRQAAGLAAVPLSEGLGAGGHELIVRSVSPTQRPRR